MKLIKCLVEDIEEDLEGAVWDWEHDKMVDTTARIKTMLSMCRGT